MNRRALKRRVHHLLMHTGYKDLPAELSVYQVKPLINTLFPLLCSLDDTIRWHAISALGIATAGLAEANLEEARTVMRRYIWMLNDESGGIGWGIPEAMAESIVRSEVLAHEYLHLLISYALADGPERFQDGNFLELPRLQRGVLWGLLRVAPNYAETLACGGLAESLGYYLSSSDAHVVGLAVKICAALKLAPAYRAQIAPYLHTCTEFDYYHEGVIYRQSIAAAAEKALASSPEDRS